MNKNSKKVSDQCRLHCAEPLVVGAQIHKSLVTKLGGVQLGSFSHAELRLVRYHNPKHSTLTCSCWIRKMGVQSPFVDPQCWHYYDTRQTQVTP